MARSSTQLLSRTLLSAALAFPLFATGAGTSTLMAADVAPAASAALAPIDPAIKKTADDFWHYVGVARYDLATTELTKLSTASVEPIVVLRAFESVAEDRKQDLDRNLARWATIDALKEPIKSLAATLDLGRLALRADQGYISDNIKRLIVNERAYQLAVARLRQSGELAVPQMVQILRANDQVQYHGAIRRALVDMGKSALSPLLASTEMKDSRVLTTIVMVLGDAGYEPAIPYVLRLSASPDSPSSVKAAAAVALQKLGASGSATPADAFYQLAERFYYDNAMITAELSQAPVAYVWYWSEEKGLSKRDVAPAIFNEIMALRATEYALAADNGKGEALSLWLAANYKREIELPAGATDPTRMEGQPDAHYYGVAAGTRYLNDVLARALKDANSPLALRAVKSLREIVGSSSLVANGATSLASALAYPDKVVRFEAAYAVGSSLPVAGFSGAEQVVPILAEGVAQTGTSGVVVVAATSEAANKLTDELKAQGYNVVGTTSADGAINQAATIPAVDAVVISEDAGTAVVDGVLAAGANSPKLGRTPKIVITHTAQSVYANRAAVDALVNLTQSSDPAQLKAEIEKARVRAGSNPLDAAAATEVAVRALGLLKHLATNKSGVDLVPARPTLVSALDDARPEIARLAGEVLAVSAYREGQIAILQKATAASTADDLKLSLLKSLSVSAKTFGNQLPSDAIASLEKVVESSDKPDLKSAAAEARGALNLPPEEAKSLILKQSQK